MTAVARVTPIMSETIAATIDITAEKVKMTAKMSSARLARSTTKIEDDVGAVKFEVADMVWAYYVSRKLALECGGR
jgi:hypothetical protein